jgi:TetR/AcrR family transcriptional regulator, cholesterol catabolism regulator
VPRPVKNPDRVRRKPSNPARRAELLRIAGEVFADMGFAHARMSDVADAAGILAGSLYHHFRSKDDILFELMQTFNGDILRDMHAIIDVEPEPINRVTALIRLALEYILERRAEARILSNDAQYFAYSPVFKEIVKGNREAEALWIDQLRVGIESGALRQDLDPEIAYATLMGSIFSALRWYRRTGRVRPAAFVDQVCLQLLKGIQAPGAVSPAKPS